MKKHVFWKRFLLLKRHFRSNGKAQNMPVVACRLVILRHFIYNMERKIFLLNGTISNRCLPVAFTLKTMLADCQEWRDYQPRLPRLSKLVRLVTLVKLVSREVTEVSKNSNVSTANKISKMSRVSNVSTVSKVNKVSKVIKVNQVIEVSKINRLVNIFARKVPLDM